MADPIGQPSTPPGRAANATEPATPAAGAKPSVPGAPGADEPVAESEGGKDLIGQLVADRYRVEALLGAGGMGAVFRAEHEMMRKKVALKVLHREMTSVPEAVVRFEREAIAAGRINHSNVVNATDFGKLPNGSCYLVLDYVSGRSLTEVLADPSPLTEARALNIATQIAAALEAAHAAGVVHRDLKPDNVMLVDSNGDPDFVKVLDFGIAKLETQESSGTVAQLTQQGSVFGTPDYMSPEQAAGNPADNRADLYSLGIILFEMLAGAPPFRADSILAVLTKHLTEDPPELPDAVSSEVKSLVRRLLEKAPGDRYQQASDVIAALKACSATGAPTGALDKEPAKAANARSEPRWIVFAQRWAALKALASLRLRFAGARLPVWAVAAFGFMLGLLLVLSLQTDKEPGAAPLTVEALAAESEDNGQLLTRAAGGDAEAIRALEALPKDQQESGTWLSVGHGYAKLGALRKSLAAYRKAVKNTPELAANRRLLDNVLRAAWLPAAHRQALKFAAEELGSSGADLLFHIWVEKPPKHDTDLDIKAKKLLLRDARKQASVALAVTLDLYTARGCKETQALLPQAIEHADTRALRQLKKRESRSGCGFLSLLDCYRCLRGDPQLEQAISAAETRAAPEFTPPRSSRKRKKTSQSQ